MVTILYLAHLYNKPSLKLCIVFIIFSFLFTACAYQPPLQQDRDTSRLYVPKGNKPLRVSKQSSLEQKIDFLIVQLRHDDPAKRASAATELGGFGSKARGAVKPLTQVLWFDKDKWARRSAAKALGKVGGPQARNALLRGVHDIDKWVRHSSAKSLQILDTPQGVTGKPVIKQYKAEGNKIRKN